MTRQHALQVMTWILARLAAESEREPLVGDLLEEYALRAQSDSSAAALRWYLQQVCASALPLLRVRLTRSAWISTLGVALLAYLAVGIVETLVNWGISNWTETGAFAYKPLGLIATFPMVVLIGYFAAGRRRGAPLVLAALMLLAVTALTLSSGENMPLWYRICYFIAGPAAVVLGRALRSRMASQSPQA